MLKAGVIGAGHLGKIHLMLLKKTNGFNLVGFYDIDPLVSQNVKKEFEVEAFEDADTLIKQCDALIIVTPTLFHFDYACRAIKAGKHIFIEKPVTVSSAESKKLVQLAHEAGIIAQAGYVERFNPAFLAGEPFVTRPVLIDCQRISTYNPRGTDVSVVLDLMIHDINLVLHLVKSTIKKISATGSVVLCDTEDIAEARIEFDNGCVANLTASRIASNNTRQMNIFQKEGYLALDFINKTAVYAEATKGEVPAGKTHVSFGDKNLVHNHLEVKPINAIAHELQLFAESIKNKKVNGVTLDEAYLTMKVADEILAVIKKGG
ncbi:MAG TPA: Gfo/Idh/MocA family oxidoreductase [Bacteroidia bacterium]|jgi:predicted dehydrogenase|nr:Gfo/Idh/MocA family oxidoreductase [Bacteroidia bacterium]